MQQAFFDPALPRDLAPALALARYPAARKTRFAEPPLAGNASGLQVHLVQDSESLKAAQALRYEVFYEELNARPSFDMAGLPLDRDAYDANCDHLAVIDGQAETAKVIGTCRLLRQPVAAMSGDFISAREFDLLPLLTHARCGPDGLDGLLELGRFCVHKDYRRQATVELLWRAIGRYMRVHRVKTLFGCAGFPTVDPAEIAQQLSFLHHFHRAPLEMRVRALPRLKVDMNKIPVDRLDPRTVLRGMPPLVKAYLRLGAYVGDGAVVDEPFGATDVFVLLPVSRIPDCYFDRFHN